MKLLSVVGNRPQFIKASPVTRQLRKTAIEVLIHTGQHYDENMSDVFFRELGLPEPDYNLGVGSCSHGVQTGEMLKKLEEVMLKERPDFVLIYGDTNSTLAGALSAAKLNIPVAHVEAGLRSFNRKMPEEVNRIVADHVSSILFAPTDTALRNLTNEGITDGVYQTGDVMYDAALQHLEVARKRSGILARLGLRPKEYILVTVHRAENTDDPGKLRQIMDALQCIAEDLDVVFPVHPRTRKALQATRMPTERLILGEPISYLDMLMLEHNARTIATDSGGVQKEAFFFRVPCVTLRNETEWVETVENGWNTLAGSDPERIISALRSATLGGQDVYPYGQGEAASRIAAILTQAASPNAATAPKRAGLSH